MTRRLGIVVTGLLAPATMAAAQVAVRVDDVAQDPSIGTGGQIRHQYERFANEDWGSEQPDANGYWLQRYMWHVDARVSRQVRLYGELKSGIEIGRSGGPRSPDEDQLDIHQAFMDVSYGAVTGRIGRQELAFGSQRLVSTREGPNVRQSFDAVSIIVAKGQWRVDGFGARHVRTESGVFDDSSTTGPALWGVYAAHSSERLIERRSRGCELYYFGYRRRHASFDQGQGRELRHSWGARVWQTSGALDYNLEAVVQRGRFARTDIRAWTMASDTGYRLETAPGRPRLGLRADVTSGDRDRYDERLGTFNPLFPRGAYFGLVASAGPSNHMDLHPQLAVTPRADLVVTTSWLFFWRQQLDDGVYGMPGNLLRSGDGTPARFVGHSPGVEAEWQVTRRLTLTANASRFTTGPFIQQSGSARAIGFIAGSATYRF